MVIGKNLRTLSTSAPAVSFRGDPSVPAEALAIGGFGRSAADAEGFINIMVWGFNGRFRHRIALRPR
jgi:hypothetical protein